jgi:hypothetical protein
MGCQCLNQKIEDADDELLKMQTGQKDFKDEENENNNSDKNEDLANLRNQGWQIADSNNENIENNESAEKKEQKSMDDNLSKNEKYANYPKNMLDLINKIRADPKSYSEIIEDSIKNIIEIEGDDENTPKYIYKKKVKVALSRGEPAFTEAAEELKSLNPLPPLELKNEICVALPEKEEENENNNSDKNEDLSNLRNQGWQIADSNNESNEKKEQKSMDDNLSKNEKYANYPKNMLEIINKIRSDPKSYSDIIEDSIKNIIEIEGDDENTPKYIYKKKVKVALARGEPAFTEAAEELKSLNPLPPLELKNEICVALPQKEKEIKDSSYLREQVKILRENTNVDVFFKDLIKIPEVSALLMIVDDSTKSPGKKRQAVLNPNYKYIGISSKFIGKTFVAYFTFSKK